MNIYFTKEEKYLLLNIETEDSLIEEPEKPFQKKLAHGALVLYSEDLIPSTQDDCINEFLYKFKFGEISGNYYLIDKCKLGTNFDLYINKNLDIDWTWFYCIIPAKVYKDKENNEHITTKYGCILHSFKDFYKQNNLYIEPDDVEAELDDGLHITKSLYKQFCDIFPSYTNVKYHRLSIFTNILREQLNVTNYEEIYNKYKTKHIKRTQKNQIDLPEINTNELSKLKYVRDMLEQALEKDEKDQFIHEDDFSKMIVDLFCLLNPKYVKVAYKLNITDFSGARTNCQPDLCLIDCDGNIDLIEVKSPQKYPNIFRKIKYRNHYVPCGELNGAINQLQQYLKSLTKMTNNEIQNNNTDLQNELDDIKLKAIHPKGYIIFGRDNNSFSGEESELKKLDFEIIKNSQSDIIDILTFDQLKNRIDRMISLTEKNMGK